VYAVTVTHCCDQSSSCSFQFVGRIAFIRLADRTVAWMTSALSLLVSCQ